MAITVTKEKNVISVLVQGKKAPYTLDINTGVVYGISGKAVKTITREVYEGFVPCINRNDVAKIIRDITHNKVSNINLIPVYANLLRLADSFDNLGIDVGKHNWQVLEVYKQLADDKTLCKEYIKYATERKENGNSYSFNDFKKEKEKKEATKKFDFDIKKEEFEDVRSYLYDIAKWATARQIKCFCVNFVYNSYYLTCNLYELRCLYDQFKKYCEYSEYIEEKVTTKDNFMSEYGRVHKAYMRQKEEIDKAKFKKAMDIHRAEMEFEYGDFRVVVPTTPQEIKDEGKNMHHCVASYAYNCMQTENKNRSHIVFVRHKDTPKKCYITCEICNGKICQYFLSHDRRIKTDEDKEFYRQYQAHLNASWKKE